MMADDQKKTRPRVAVFVKHHPHHAACSAAAAAAKPAILLLLFLSAALLFLVSSAFCVLSFTFTSYVPFTSFHL
jgi:hypothetical protein